MGDNSGSNNRQKRRHLEQLAAYREDTLKKHPELRTLFLEMTVRCNEHCRHCGSSCGDIREEEPLSKEEILGFLHGLKGQMDISRLKLCITGGEPLLRPDFFAIMEGAHRLGYQWGMTSNGLLMDKETVTALARTGMRTVSVSLDGLKESHEWFRQLPGSFGRTLEGVRNLLAQGSFDHVQITTVVHHRNIGELEELYRLVSSLGVRSWRVINMEPIGRAKEQPELCLSPEEYRQLFAFIREKRFAGPVEVCYGCSHFLGIELEREVRPWYFLCNAGVYTASICYNGDITSCLDLERRPEYIEGNIRRDDFLTVWRDGFAKYRTDFRRTGKCASCEYFRYCGGDSFHSWNLEEMRPELCFRGILF